MEIPGEFMISIITLSDRASKGEYDDKSGPRIKELVSDFFSLNGWRCSIYMTIIPDDKGRLKKLLEEQTGTYNLIFTTGGTGIGPRDITVETVIPFLSKEIPGIMEFIRVKYGSVNPNALLSRGVAGVAGRSLIYTLPGSVKAVDEYLTEILKTLKHTIQMLYGIDSHSSSL
ncbi:MAG TPA: MogA/MoaB family molybdenum cofactor biosynthesis protein [Bacteroidales bacterium]|nr:MogA/MoaB family molybdenum cofactor biosynthesis protein [Bacteroidales bacterium]